MRRRPSCSRFGERGREVFASCRLYVATLRFPYFFCELVRKNMCGEVFLKEDTVDVKISPDIEQEILKEHIVV